MEFLPWTPLTRRELLEIGLSENQLRSLLRGGVLRVVFHGVYVRADADDNVELRAEAAAMILGPDHIVCDRSAAFLHGVDVYGVRESSRELETCVMRGGTPSRHRGIDGRRRALAERDLMSIGRARVTTPLRTALDLGCALPRHRALGALDELARKHGLASADLARECGRYRGRRGVVQLRELAPLVDPLAESPRESWVRLAIIDAGLPTPTLQWKVIERGVEIFRLDLAYPHHLIAIEYDGKDAHERTEEQIRYDEERRTWLRDHGWDIIVVTRRDLRDGADAEWLLRLRESLRPRTQRFRWELGRRPDSN